MAADDEIKVLLTADMAQLQAGMEAGAASVRQSTDAMRASVAEATSQYAAFDAIQKGSIQTAAELASAQDALAAVQNTGAYTAEELAEKQAIIAAAMKKVGVETEAAAGLIDKITSNSRTMYSVSALVTDAMTGQFGRMRREVAAVSNETGLLGIALNYLLSPAGLVAAAIAGIAAAAISAKDAIDQLATSAQAGGGMAGMSKDQLESMAQGFKQYGYDISTARHAIEALSASGRVSADSMRSATQASLDLAQLTGKDAEKIAEQLSRLGSSGLDGILRMDEQYHFLNDSQRTHIAQMFQEGQATQGVKEAFDALADKEHSRVEALKKDQGDVEGFWARMGTHVANAWDSATKTMHMGLTDQQQVDHLNKVIAYQQRIGGGEKYINQLIAERAALLDKIAERQKAAAAEGAEAKHGADQDQSILHKPRGAGGAAQFEKALQDEEAAQKISYDHRAAFEMEYWGQILQTAKAGSAEYTVAWQKTQELQKQIDQEQLAEWRRTEAEKAAAARKAAADAAEAHRKASEEAMNALEMERAGTAANTAERIQADAAILASATRLYGAYSAQQKTALAQMLADEKSYDAAVVKDQEEMEKKLEADHAAYVTRVQKVSDEAAKKAAATWHQYLDPINRAFQQSIQGMIQGTQTLRQMTANILQSIAASYVQEGLKDLENHIITQQAKTAATAAGAAERATIEATAAAQSKATDAATGKSQITTAAATGAAKAYQAIVGIPYVGPILAPIAAGVAFAGIEAFSANIASARGGWDRVPFDGAMTELHKDEMVLPKPLADGVRQMTKGGQGGAPQVHLHTTDPRSFKDYLRRNPGAIASAVKLAGRRGHMLGAR